MGHNAAKENMLERMEDRRRGWVAEWPGLPSGLGCLIGLDYGVCPNWNEIWCELEIFVELLMGIDNILNS